jgi:hypothetical protein
MKKEELLEWFKRQKWFIKGILNESHRSESWVESDEQAYMEIAAIIKNQPTITKRDIECWADEAKEQVTSHRDWAYIGDTMKEMLEDIDVTIRPEKSTVVDKEEK